MLVGVGVFVGVGVGVGVVDEKQVVVTDLTVVFPTESLTIYHQVESDDPTPVAKALPVNQDVLAKAAAWEVKAVLAI